jgi:hypothetical protein
MSTKAQRRVELLERHYKALTKLAEICGVENPNGKKLSNKLRKLEAKASAISIKYGDGEMTTNERIALAKGYGEEVQLLFNHKLDGLIVYDDVRGYQLKIAADFLHPDTGKYKDVKLFTNLGQDGLLAPEITGE